MIIIYSLSGIALNHMKDWNPNYDISRKKIKIEKKLSQNEIQKETVLSILDKKENYKKHYFPKPEQLKVFIFKGSVDINLVSGLGVIEKIKKRPIFYEVNFLHYNPGKLWMYFSDFFCVSLIIIAFTGLFVIKGKRGIKGRGAWLTVAGVIIPLLFLLMYL